MVKTGSSSLHTFWYHVPDKNQALQILKEAKQKIWEQQVEKYQERLILMSEANNISLQQFESLIALTADDQIGEQTRLEVFEAKLKQFSGYSSFNELKQQTGGRIKNLSYATTEIYKMKEALEDVYATLWNICSQPENIKSYQEIVMNNFFSLADGKTLEQMNALVKKTMTTKNSNSEKVYNELVSDLMADLGRQDNVVIKANFVKNGAGLSAILNKMFNKIQGAINILDAVIQSNGVKNTTDIVQTLGNYVGQMIDTSLGFVLEGFETQLLDNKVFDAIELQRFNEKFAGTFKIGSVTRTGESFGQDKVKTGDQKIQETSATADVIAKYNIDMDGQGSVEVLIPISVKGYKLNAANKTNRSIHVLSSGSSRNIESLLNDSQFPINKELIYNIFGSRAGVWKGIKSTSYSAKALGNEVQEVRAISGYMLLVDSLSGRAGGIDINKNAVIFDLNGKFFTISNLLKRLEPNSKEVSKLSLAVESLKRNKKLIDPNPPGLGSDEQSEELKEQRFQRVRQMFLNTKANVSLRNLGL